MGFNRILIGYVLNMINLIGILDRIIGYYIWMVFFHPNSDVSRPAGAFLAGTFLFFCYVIFLKIVIHGKKK